MDEKPSDVPETFAEIGRDAARAAQKDALLKALNQSNWNLSATSDALGMGSPANVLRSIRLLGLCAEYERAKAAGMISTRSRRALAA